MLVILFYLGLAGVGVSLVLLFPALAAFSFGETTIGFSLLIYAALGGFLSITFLVMTGRREANLDRRAALALAVGGWVLFPILLAFPISGVFEISYPDALFEAVSALTTTAADGVGGLEGLPRSAILMRSSIQWVGGLGTILTFFILLGPTGVGGLPKTRQSIGEGSGRRITGISRSAVYLTRYYIICSIICFSALMLTGIDPFSSMVLASTAISAGGYLPSQSQLYELVNDWALLVMSAFFLLASTSIYWHRMVRYWQVDNLVRHRESYYLFTIVLLVALLFLAVFVSTPGMLQASGALALTVEAIFNASSLVSTSGLQSSEGVFTLLAPAFVFAIVLIGGGCYSLAGGIKYYRVGAMLFHARQDLHKLIYPNSVSPGKFGTERYDLSVMKSIWVMFTASLVVLALGGALLATLGLDFQASITASIAAFSNAGPAYSEVWAARGTDGWTAYHDMPISMKMILALIMLFGHLEVIAVLVALDSRGLWQRR